MNMLQSPLQSRLTFGDAPDGAPIASVLAKATYLLTPNGLVVPDNAEQSIPLWENLVLEQGADPLLSPVLHTSDLVAYQPYCKVVVHGHACAPTGKRARFFDMGISVGNYARRIRVLGKRFIDSSKGSIHFSEPEAFERIPFSLALAYGGKDSVTNPEEIAIYPYNPFGKGFWLNPDPTSIHGAELPCLEDPSRLLEPGNLFLRNLDLTDEIPRPAHLGECPAVRSEIPGFVVPYVQGNEIITLAYMDHDHPQYKIPLPNMEPRLGLDFGEGMTWLEPQLQKIEIDKDKDTITLLWRGSSYCAPLEDLVDCPRMEVVADWETNNG